VAGDGHEADERHRDAPAAVDGVDVREVVLAEDDDAQPVAAGQRVGASGRDLEVLAAIGRVRAAAERQHRAKEEEGGSPVHEV